MKNENKHESWLADKSQHKGKPHSDFVTGLVTFILFLIFMFVWMYFGVSD